MRSKELGATRSKTDTGTDTNFGTPSEFAITGGNANNISDFIFLKLRIRNFLYGMLSTLRLVNSKPNLPVFQPRIMTKLCRAHSAKPGLGAS
jgi:hypothetical protein